MSKITINAVLTVLRLVMFSITKACRLIYAIMDLVDDGCINASVPRPDWMIVLTRALESMQTISTDLSRVEDEVQQVG